MGPANPIRVLYVEDDQGLARLLQKRLERAGFHVDIALDGRDEFAKRQLWTYDVLAVDHDMPGKSGLELIRDLAEQGNLPVTIMITGAGDEGVAVEAMKLGASDYVIKDSDSRYLDALPSVMEQALNKEKLKERQKAAQDALKRSHQNLEKKVGRQEATLFQANQKLQREMEGRAKAEAAFRVSESRFRALFEESLDALSLTDSDHCIIDANRSFGLLFGLDENKAQGRSMERLFLDPSQYLQMIRELETKGFIRDFEFRARTANSEIRDCLVTASVMPGTRGIGVGFQHIIRDITVRKEAERAVQEDRERLEENVVARTEELLRTNERLKREIWAKERAQIELKRSSETIQALLDASNDQVALLGKGGAILLINRTLANAAGMAPETIVGKDIFQIWDREIASSRAEYVDSVIGTGDALRFQDSCRGVIYENTICPVPDLSGATRAVALFIRDVTDQIKAQELQIDAARFKAVADLASGVAHNFNNLLQIILAAAQSVMFDMNDQQGQGSVNTLERIVSSCKTGSEMVKRLQKVAGVRRELVDQEVEIFDLSEVLKEAAEMTKAWRLNTSDLIGVNIGMEIDARPGCLVKAVRSEMIEVFINLIKNAAEALPEGGLIRLECQSAQEEIRVRVIDNGIGMTEEEQKRLFTPFYTTKISSGAGLGLATSKVILEKRGGGVCAESKPNQGTTIHVTMPAAYEAPTPATHEPEPRPVGPSRLLLIDDDLTTLDLLEKTLAGFGFQVMTAASGEAGLALLEENEVDLIICDLGMPQMNGWETAKRIYKLCEDLNRPRPKFVILTGWGGQADIESKAREIGIDTVMEKPATIETLMGTLSELISKS